MHPFEILKYNRKIYKERLIKVVNIVKSNYSDFRRNSFYKK